jgi:asparagine synthase (glutamine-hydrolysing)
MCGIAGIISADKNRISGERLRRMSDSILHRGPESGDYWIDKTNNVGFGHRRLSIIDLSDAGAQPMHYLDRYTIVYNGEIYNYVELLHELRSKGFQFHSACDTEVVLAAYAAYGRDCLQYFDGMFAFAIWDEKEQTLFCARDRFGEKPFYFSFDDKLNELVFASEMKALWAAGVSKQANNTMLLNYLALGWVQSLVDKQQTFYSNVSSLAPAHYLLYKHADAKSVELHRYWDLDKEHQMNDCSDAFVKTKFLELLTTSVQRRLRSDVPIGSSLSGGLDSSGIVAIVNTLIDKVEKQKTFSAVFPNFEKDESEHIKQVVTRFRIDNFQVTPTADEFISDFEKLCWHQEEPFQSSSIYAQYRVYQLAKQHGVTVILDGQGADEILAGYHKYYHWYWQELLAKKNWSLSRQERNYATANGLKNEWSLRNSIAAYMPELAAKQLEKRSGGLVKHSTDINSDFIKSNFEKQGIYKPVVEKLNDILYFNTMQFGLEELLRYADRNSMAHSREVRLPFLSHELVQFVFSVPSSFKIYHGFTKHLLRLSMNEYLPKEIVWRKDKVGFEPPQKQWMQHAQVQEFIVEGRRTLVNAGILNEAVIDKPIDQQSAHEDKNFDWRYICAANTLSF